MKPLRKLNDEGLEEFEAWIAEGGVGKPPVELLTTQTTSVPVSGIMIDKPVVTDRYAFGQYLVELLQSLNPADLSSDRYLWSSLALLWFDHLCPPMSTGRKLDKSYRYVLSTDYRHYYRHLVRSPWQLVRDHGPNARLLLLSTTERPSPLRIHGEILEQLGGRQGVLRSKSIIAEANLLFGDPATGRPRPRVASKNVGGTVRRLGMVLRQFDLTFDVEDMPEHGLVDLLPREFDRWKEHTAA
jgi:hypothetical protein